MIDPARKIVFPSIAPAERPSASQKPGIDRRRIADRMLGRGILPHTRLGMILAHPLSRDKQLAEIMRVVLTFDHYQPASDTINDVVKEVESMTAAEVAAEAQKVVDRLYRDKIARYDNPAMRADFAAPPTVEDFSRIPSNGHFDPYQYFASESWGALNARLDYGRIKGYERVLANFDLRKAFREAFIMALALEKIPA